MSELIGVIIEYKYVFIALAAVITLILLAGKKPFRAFVKYLLGNTLDAAVYAAICFVCSMFGVTVFLNAYTLLVAFFLGLPGVSMLLFLQVINA